MEVVILSIAAYLLGSIPSSVWVGKLFYGVDVRQSGSKNAGATNTLRTIGLKAAIPVLLFDVFKAFAATRLTVFLHGYSDVLMLHFSILFGLLATVGHIFPIFARFKGGKGIACLSGTIAGLSPFSLLACVVFFVVIVGISKWVSLGSILSAAALPFIFYYFTNERDLIMLIFSVTVVLIVVLTHRKNIQRILQGEENAISFRKKNKNDNSES